VNAKNENVSKFGPTIFTNTKTKIGWHQSALLNFLILDIILNILQNHQERPTI
jgi:hypothetical protein